MCDVLDRIRIDSVIFYVGFEIDEQVPIEPKLLAVPTSWARFVSYKSSASLDAMRQHDFLLEPELGIPLDLLEAPQYQVPRDYRRHLDPEDEALLRSDNKSVPGVIVNGKHVPVPNIVSRSAGVARDFTWLMKTQYISNEDAPKQVSDASQIEARQIQK